MIKAVFVFFGISAQVFYFFGLMCVLLVTGFCGYIYLPKQPFVGLILLPLLVWWFYLFFSYFRAFFTFRRTLNWATYLELFGA